MSEADYTPLDSQMQKRGCDVEVGEQWKDQRRALEPKTNICTSHVRQGAATI